MSVQERPCPACGIRRTLRLWRHRSLCANCKHQWPARHSLGEFTPSPHPPANAIHPFTASELARLRSYRAAVASGLYTDSLPSARYVAEGRDPDSGHMNQKEPPPCPTC